MVGVQEVSGTKYVIPHAHVPASGTSTYNFPTGLEGQVWTWHSGVPQWETPNQTLTGGLTYGYIFAPLSPCVGNAGVTVFTMAFPVSGTTIVHLHLQGIVLDLTDDASMVFPCEMNGRFRVMDPGFPSLAMVQETGLVSQDNTTWQWHSVYNTDHNEVSFVIAPSSTLWQTLNGLPTSFGVSSQWTFNFEVVVRTEYTSAALQTYSPVITSTNGMYRLNQIFSY